MVYRIKNYNCISISSRWNSSFVDLFHSSFVGANGGQVVASTQSGRVARFWREAEDNGADMQELLLPNHTVALGLVGAFPTLPFSAELLLPDLHFVPVCRKLPDSEARTVPAAGRSSGEWRLNLPHGDSLLVNKSHRLLGNDRLAQEQVRHGRLDLQQSKIRISLYRQVSHFTCFVTTQWRHISHFENLILTGKQLYDWSTEMAILSASSATWGCLSGSSEFAAMTKLQKSLKAATAFFPV